MVLRVWFCGLHPELLQYLIPCRQHFRRATLGAFYSTRGFQYRSGPRMANRRLSWTILSHAPSCVTSFSKLRFVYRQNRSEQEVLVAAQAIPVDCTTFSPGFPVSSLLLRRISLFRPSQLFQVSLLVRDPRSSFFY